VDALCVLVASIKRQEHLLALLVPFVRLDLLLIQHQPVVLRVLDRLTKHKIVHHLLHVPHGQRVLRVDMKRQHRHH
jgi:hypothetical protein